MKVLIVEDEPSVAGVMHKGLTENGYSVTLAPDGLLGLDIAQKYSFDVIVLDIMLPGINGLELCKRLRADGLDTPVLFLTALSTTENIVGGLDSGGDDYLTKPFKFAELQARLRALARRKPATANNTDLFSFGNLSIDFTARLLLRDGSPVALTPTEFRLLECFVRNRNKVLSRLQLLEQVWSIDFNLGTNVVDVYVNYLRKKMASGSGQHFIQTIVGRGYIFKPESGS